MTTAGWSNTNPSKDLSGPWFDGRMMWNSWNYWKCKNKTEASHGLKKVQQGTIVVLGDIVGGSRNRAAPRGRSRPCRCVTDTADALGRALGIVFRKPNKKSTIWGWIIQSISIYFDFGIFCGWCTIGLAALHSYEKLSSSMAFVSLSVRVYGVWWLYILKPWRTVWSPVQFFFVVLKVMNLTTEKNPSDWMHRHTFSNDRCVVGEESHLWNLSSVVTVTGNSL